MARTIRISDEVWEAIAARGKFGETENDVLERVLGIQRLNGLLVELLDDGHTMKLSPRKSADIKRNSFSTIRMSSGVSNGVLYVSFENGISESWQLPDKSDKAAIRSIRDQAVEFAKNNGAVHGQLNAVKKALTDAEYWLVK